MSKMSLTSLPSGGPRVEIEPGSYDQVYATVAGTIDGASNLKYNYRYITKSTRE